MEPYPRVFVSNTSTDEWKSDPEVPGSQMHELVHADGLWSGLTRFTDVDGPVTWTPQQREVVHLHLFEGLTFREIAEASGASLNTVAARYRYALAKLRVLLDGVSPDHAQQRS